MRQFSMNSAQRQFHRDMWYRNVILKARQLGLTTFLQIFMLDSAVFFPHTASAVIAHTEDDAKTIFDTKIKFAYDRLPQAIRDEVSIVRSNQTELYLSNGSSIKVGTSFRSGTIHNLHVSEMGKIAARYPDKAREIVTGSFATVAPGNYIFVESTAEGAQGRFYDLCQAAMSKARMGDELTPQDFKFHFFPWWEDVTYVADPAKVNVTPHIHKYFSDLAEVKNIHCSPEQIAWYVKELEVMGDDMRREYPSYPEEAFEQLIEGAYYASVLATMETNGQIRDVPYDPMLEVETWWDIGRNDDNVIWFIQRYRNEIHVIDYYANSGEGLPHYAKVLREKPYRYSRHVGPHDSAVHEWSTNAKRSDTAEQLGLRPWVIAPKLGVIEGIDAVRALLPRCYFDRTKCSKGLTHLREYRKDWNDKLGVWMSTPRHDENSHSADAFRTGAVTRPPSQYSDGPITPLDFGAV